jgi:hypothetical protein
VSGRGGGLHVAEEMGVMYLQEHRGIEFSRELLRLDWGALSERMSALRVPASA